MSLPDLRTKHINFTISIRQLAEVDELAIRDYCTRSDIIRIALTEYIRKPANVAVTQSKPGVDVELEEVLRQFHESENE